MYLVAVLDWFSRYVVSWELDQTLEMPFVVATVQRALAQATPVIWNSDQGSHFTSPQYTQLLLNAGVQISMDGKDGRWTTSSPNACGVESKSSLNNTTISKTGSAEETVRVVDPRHPLFGQTFRLIAITTWRQTETRCVIWLQDDGVERHIPLSVTDRSPDPPVIFPSTLNMASLGRLVECFHSLCSGFYPAMEVTADEPTQSASLSPERSGGADALCAGVEHAQSSPTRDRPTCHAPGVLPARQPESMHCRQQGANASRRQQHGGGS